MAILTTAGTDDAGYTRFSYRPDSSAIVVNPQFGEGLRARQVIFPIAAGEVIPAYYVEVNLTGELAGVRALLLVRDQRGGRPGAVPEEPRRGRHVPYRVLRGHGGAVPAVRQSRRHHRHAAPDRPPRQLPGAGATTNDVAIESLIGPTDPWLASGRGRDDRQQRRCVPRRCRCRRLHGGRHSRRHTAAGQFLPDWSHTNSSQDAVVRQSKAVHMFFYNNWLHDVWYQRGFNEVSFNAQTDNYGRGGARRRQHPRRGRGPDRHEQRQHVDAG